MKSEVTPFQCSTYGNSSSRPWKTSGDVISRRTKMYRNWYKSQLGTIAVPSTGFSWCRADMNALQWTQSRKLSPPPADTHRWDSVVGDMLLTSVANLWKSRAWTPDCDMNCLHIPQNCIWKASSTMFSAQEPCSSSSTCSKANDMLHHI
jgi:hypothetical protein